LRGQGTEFGLGDGEGTKGAQAGHGGLNLRADHLRATIQQLHFVMLSVSVKWRRSGRWQGIAAQQRQGEPSDGLLAVRPDAKQFSHVHDGRCLRLNPVPLTSHLGAFGLEVSQKRRRLFVLVTSLADSMAISSWRMTDVKGAQETGRPCHECRGNIACVMVNSDNDKSEEWRRWH
jgi:hypothetical protein